MGPPPQKQVKTNRGAGPAVEKQITGNKLDCFQCCKGDGSSCNIHHGGKGKGIDRKLPTSNWSMTTIPKDIAKYAIDPAVRIDVKASDIARHSVDDKLDSFQRALLCLKGEDDNCKSFVAQNFDSLIVQNTERAFKEVLPLIEKETKKESNPEFHIEAAKSILRAYTFLRQTQRINQAQTLLKLTIAKIDATDPNISAAWCESLENISDSLTSKELQREIFPIIPEKVKSKTNGNSRVAATKLIGRLVARLPEEVWAKRLLPIVELLCRDESPLVRTAICTQLPAISLGMKDKDSIVSLYQTLAKDNSTLVKTAIVSAIGKTVTSAAKGDMTLKLLFETMIPILKTLVKEAFTTGNTSLLIQFTRYMGPMSRILTERDFLNGPNKLWFLDAYLQLSRYGLPQSSQKGKPEMPTGFMNFRANMEFNRRRSLIESLISSGETNKATKAPMVKQKVKGQPGKNVDDDQESADAEWICRANAAEGFADSLSFALPLVDFRNGLHPMVTELMHDPVSQVRAAISSNLYAIMEQVGQQGALLHGEVVYALSDDKVNVTEALLPNLANILKVFVREKLISPDHMTSALVEIGGALLFCEERLSQTTDWRIHTMLLEQLAVLPFCIPSDYIYSHFVPSLFHRFNHLKQLPSRMAAADAIISFMRHCRKHTQREEISTRMKQTFAQGRSFQDRMLFVFMSQRIMKVFSRKYYRDHFFETTLDMAVDPVSNVRLKVVETMPAMKATLMMAEDDRLLKKMEEIARRVQNSETDRDVQAAIETAVSEMEKIGVVLKSDNKKRVKTKEEIEDEAKQMEEEYIASLEAKAAGAQKDKRQSFFRTSRRHNVDARGSVTAAGPLPSIDPGKQLPTPEVLAPKRPLDTKGNVVIIAGSTTPSTGGKGKTIPTAVTTKATTIPSQQQKQQAQPQSVSSSRPQTGQTTPGQLPQKQLPSVAVPSKPQGTTSQKPQASTSQQPQQPSKVAVVAPSRPAVTLPQKPGVVAPQKQQALPTLQVGQQGEKALVQAPTMQQGPQIGGMTRKIGGGGGIQDILRPGVTQPNSVNTNVTATKPVGKIQQLPQLPSAKQNTGGTTPTQNQSRPPTVTPTVTNTSQSRPPTVTSTSQSRPPTSQNNKTGGTTTASLSLPVKKEGGAAGTKSHTITYDPSAQQVKLDMLKNAGKKDYSNVGDVLQSVRQHTTRTSIMNPSQQINTAPAQKANTSSKPKK